MRPPTRPRRFRGERGAVSAEYAVLIIAAVAFAGLLLKVVTSSGVASAITDLIEKALQ
ncbi:hypothetical protein Afil01_52560 [Actinorhabdospora filicis]|uniref:DUF4244 domain-containing protein n=1 Tax=Actinorhabdospora filicis TaxID=1785913 RepID=A0A9W6WBA9_9ACTN|nr:DUF4244 domain-containing protein [Actinorhabdospora filicis]GLZ80449.1 hypothetical protein Afil01_52560 [Actinorhabdospora filicis]